MNTKIHAPLLAAEGVVSASCAGLQILLGNLCLLLFQHKISGKNQAIPVLTGNLMRFLESKACRI